MSIWTAIKNDFAKNKPRQNKKLLKENNIMKRYVPVKLVIKSFLEEDLLAKSPLGVFEGISDINPDSDWFN